mmetsp:Transcript_7159/g.27405  ORF Transcript_7159/g.27405 Transcript_7159/m.27405 type:complete len:248 (+) Transcript_7159:805-1548(+)
MLSSAEPSSSSPVVTAMTLVVGALVSGLGWDRFSSSEAASLCDVAVETRRTSATIVGISLSSTPFNRASASISVLASSKRLCATYHLGDSGRMKLQKKGITKGMQATTARSRQPSSIGLLGRMSHAAPATKMLPRGQYSMYIDSIRPRTSSVSSSMKRSKGITIPPTPKPTKKRRIMSPVRLVARRVSSPKVSTMPLLIMKAFWRPMRSPRTPKHRLPRNSPTNTTEAKAAFSSADRSQAWPTASPT